MKAFVCVVGVSAFGVCGLSEAHHSNAQFDTSKILEFEATVTAFEWKNPHVFVQVDTRDADGNTAHLQVEGDGISILIPLGWSRDSLQTGERVTIEASPPKNSARRSVLGRAIIKSDGTVLSPNPEFLRTSSAAGRLQATSLSGVWLPRREDFFGYLASVAHWPLTEKGAGFLAAYDGTQNPQANCVSVTSPVLMVYMVYTKIDVQPDKVAIHSDWMSVDRVAYLDGREHPDPSIRFEQGHTIGHWEGETLVLDTANFTQHSAGLVVSVPSGSGKHLLERLTLSSDGTSIDYDYVLEDPEYLKSPVSGHSQWAHRPDLQPSESACDIEAARRFLEPVGAAR